MWIAFNFQILKKKKKKLITIIIFTWLFSSFFIEELIIEVKPLILSKRFLLLFDIIGNLFIFSFTSFWFSHFTIISLLDL